jgi:ABC-type transporter Mla subunit MlaD
VDDAKDAVADVADQLDETVDTVTDVVDEIAGQLGLDDSAVAGALDDAGTDLEAVTQDVLDLVDQGVPLDEAVDQVLGQLPVASAPPIVPLPSVPPILPAPSPSGLIGGLLG